ncbi:MAG: hypothetical protein AAGB14_00995 [Verrucomicrobiota bacterium]
MPSQTVIALRKQLREKFPAAHRSCGILPQAVPAASSRAPPPRREAPHPSTFHPPPPSSSAAGFSPASAELRHDKLFTRHSCEAGIAGITEISPAHPSCGLSLLVASLLAEDDSTETPPYRNTEVLVLIDARDRFDPASLSDAECARLLWLRCRDTDQALKSADLLLRDGNLPFILLDLSALPARELRRIPNSSWHRLRQLAESTDSTLLALTPTPLIPRAVLRLSLTRPLQLDDLQRSRRELFATLQTETTRHHHQTRSA